MKQITIRLSKQEVLELIKMTAKCELSVKIQKQFDEQNKPLPVAANDR